MHDSIVLCYCSIKLNDSVLYIYILNNKYIYIYIVSCYTILYHTKSVYISYMPMAHMCSIWQLYRIFMQFLPGTSSMVAVFGGGVGGGGGSGGYPPQRLKSWKPGKLWRKHRSTILKSYGNWSKTI